MKRVLLIIAAALFATASAIFCVIGLCTGQREIPVRHFKAANVPSAETNPVERPNGTVDINSDEIDDLTMLYGVGESLAARIIEERLANGSYHYPEDLYAVSGVGAGKVSGFREQLDFSWE